MAARHAHFGVGQAMLLQPRWAMSLRVLVRRLRQQVDARCNRRSDSRATDWRPRRDQRHCPRRLRHLLGRLANRHDHDAAEIRQAADYNSFRHWCSGNRAVGTVGRTVTMPKRSASDSLP